MAEDWRWVGYWIASPIFFNFRVSLVYGILSKGIYYM
jgi:hypothetical protein